MKTSSSGRRATSSLVAALAVIAFGCGGAAASAPAARASAVPSPPGASTVAYSSPVDFAFESIDDRPVTSEAMRGTPTVLAFVTTGSLSSQAQVDFLVAMAKHDDSTSGRPPVRYAVVALESSDNRELVEMYKKALSIPFPVALADAPTLAGAGAFGDVSAVPVTVVLDRAGRVAWRVDGRVVRSQEMRAALRGL